MEGAELVKRMRAAREQWVEAGGFRFLIRRPTDWELAKKAQGSRFELVFEHVVDWDGVREADLIPGGSDEAQSFDAAVWRDFIADRPDLWERLLEAVIDACNRHAESVAALRKI
jgi:hypothetical protein